MDAVAKSVLSYSLGQVDAFVASVSAEHPEWASGLSSAAASFRAEQVAAQKKSASTGRRGVKRGGDEAPAKRKLSAYNEFMGAKMRELSSLHPETSKRDLMKQAAELWRAHKASAAK
jgi:hypothetical protein